MKNKILLIITISTILILPKLGYAQEKINVVSTIGQITDAVNIIGGEHLEAQGLMGPGVDPHLYKTSESDVRKLTNAQIIFYNGLYLEAKMEVILKKMKRFKTTVAISEDLEDAQYLDSVDYPGHFDPHVWFEVPTWKKSISNIAKTLIKHDPDNASTYQANFDAYLLKLDQLHEYIVKRSSEVPKEQRILVTAHDAFRYFGRAYGFKVVGLQGISTDSQAGTKDVIELAMYIAKNKIRAIFIESSVPERNIKAVQEAVRAQGWDVKVGGELFSDAMGDEGTVEGTYIGMLTHNIDTIVDALKEN